METSSWLILVIVGLYLSISYTRGELDTAKKRLLKIEQEFAIYKTDEYRRVKKIVDQRVSDIVERANRDVSAN